MMTYIMKNKKKIRAHLGLFFCNILNFNIYNLLIMAYWPNMVEMMGVEPMSVEVSLLASTSLVNLKDSHKN